MRFKEYVGQSTVIETLHSSIVTGEPLSEDIMAVLSVIRKKITELLEEGAEAEDGRVKKYLKYLAAFEQYFKFLDNRKMDINDEQGLGAFVADGSEKISDDVLDTRLTKQIAMWSRKDGYPNFQAIIESRFKQFAQWFDQKSKEDLNIIRDAVRFVQDRFQAYEYNTRRLAA